jgi:1-acyl-sn-glycerol-3-phosphate acyltransferase
VRALPLVRGTLASAVLAVNTLGWCIPLFALALAKLALPLAGLHRHIDRALNAVAAGWISGNSLWIGLYRRTAWDVSGASGLRRDAWYLVTCNHQSWVDILVLQRVMNRRIPMLKFFLKRQLLYVPIMGLAWWALGFPFMRRHSKAALRRRPELRGQDSQTARRACKRFAALPTSVMNFVEGTRFSPRKHASQGSPYRHLLKPRTGALAATLGTLGPRFTEHLDVTIVYPDGVPSFWQFLCGRAGASSCDAIGS